MEAVEKLAEYFTGWHVAHNSIMLSHGGRVDKKMAEEFFDMRNALGITGYMTKEDAIQRIKEKLNV